MMRGRTLAIVGVLGVLSYLRFGKNLSFNAESGNGMTTIVERIKNRFSPSDLEQITGERTGATVDTIPMTFNPSSSQAGHFAFDKTTTYVNTAPYGPGVSDYKISVQDAYADSLRAEDFQVFNATAPGQEMIPSAIAPLKSIQPTSKAVCCKPVSSYGMTIASLESVKDTDRAALPMLQSKRSSDTLNPNSNDNYTDGSKTQTLAQWMHEGHVDVVNGAVAVFRPHLGGSERRLRRV